MTKKLIINGKSNHPKKQDVNSSKRILLIDEADIFFNGEFYGKCFTPSCLWKDPLIDSIQQYIWENSVANLNYKQQFENIQKREDYQKLIDKNNKLEKFIN